MNTKQDPPSTSNDPQAEGSSNDSRSPRNRNGRSRQRTDYRNKKPQLTTSIPEESAQASPLIRQRAKQANSTETKSEESSSFSLSFRVTTSQQASTSSSNKDIQAESSKELPGLEKALTKAQDLRSRQSVNLKYQKYECPICYETIYRKQAIWNCKNCWSIFHLGCVQKWAKKSTISDATAAGGWRCPGCQNLCHQTQFSYFCFCGKVERPESNRLWTPHSCGEPCGKSRKCSHPCNIPCHPGPCPPCGLFAPSQWCFCQKKEIKMRCTEATEDLLNTKSCGNICEKPLGCGNHFCEENCHEGDCTPCDEVLVQICECGKEELEIPCGQTMQFKCKNRCGFVFDCGEHLCDSICHSQHQHQQKCIWDPESWITCNCSKRLIKDISPTIRKVCEDPIPSCGQVCGKVHPCGHSCSRICHLEPCPPCKVEVRAPCRCARTVLTLSCHSDPLNNPPACDTICNKKKNCGKHRCAERCCASSGVEEQHQCSLVCGKSLKCGNHQCQQPCHKGHCPPCLIANFDEVSCHCGRTVTMPPIRCGTVLQSCSFPCQRPRSCPHPETPHNCHRDNEPCPPCFFQSSRQCWCGKTQVLTPCHKMEVGVGCGKPCEKLLRCGGHKCNRSCHLEDCSLIDCTEICKKPLPCGHSCKERCHAPAICTGNCSAPVLFACPCGRIQRGGKCGETTSIVCSVDCEQQKRLSALKEALQIGSEAEKESKTMYEDVLIHFCTHNRAWVKKLEDTFTSFLQSSKRTLNLAPMKKTQRQVVCLLSMHYNFSSEVIDEEPYRSVRLIKRGSSKQPLPMLSQVQVEWRALNGSEGRRREDIVAKINAILVTNVDPGFTPTYLSAMLEGSPTVYNLGQQYLIKFDAFTLSPPELEAWLVRFGMDFRTAMLHKAVCDEVMLCKMSGLDGTVYVGYSPFAKPIPKQLFATTTTTATATTTTKEVPSVVAVADDKKGSKKEQNNKFEILLEVGGTKD